jgi:GlpG protein
LCAREKVRRCWVTGAAIAVSILVFLGLNAESNPGTWEALGKWGAPSSEKVWSGAYWALLTSAAVHQALWHLAFNMYWLWVLGSRLEQAIGSTRYLILIVGAALVTSGSQLAVSDATGIGASGVVYSIFGFMFVLRSRFPAFREVVSSQTVNLFIVWLVVCMITTYANLWQVGNAAHVSGLLFGSAIAGLVLKRRRLLLAPALTALVVGSLLPVFWCPWSVTWLGVQASRAYAAGDHERAIAYCGRVIARDPSAAWAYYNRGVSCLATGDRETARADFAKASSLDPNLPMPTLPEATRTP